MLFFLTAGGLVLVTYYYGDDIKDRVVGELNKNLEAEISVGTININLYKSFPNATINFLDVVSKEKNEKPGQSLIKAERISLLFNIYDILHQNYTLKRIKLEGGFLNLIKRADGSKNFEIIKHPGQGEESDVIISIQKIDFKNISIFYLDQTIHNEYFFRINKATLELTDKADFKIVDAQGNIYSNYLKIGKQTYIKERELDVDLTFSISGTANSIEGIRGHISTQNLLFDISGKIEYSNAFVTDLEVKASSAPISSFVNLIPAEYIKPYAEYTLVGNVNFIAFIKGKLTQNEIPSIQISFNLHEGKFQSAKNNIKLNGLSFSGSFDNGKLKNESSYKLDLHDVVASHPAGKISGNIHITDFNRPELRVSFHADLDIDKLNREINFEQLDQVAGRLIVDMEFNKKLLDYRKFTTRDFVNSKTSGTLEVINAEFSLKRNKHSYKNFNGSFEFSNKDLVVRHFTGSVSKSDFNMEGSFQNLLAYLFLPDEAVNIQARFKSRTLDLNNLFEQNTMANDKEFHLTFSKLVNFNLEMAIDSFSFRKFKASDITGQVQLNNRLFTVKRASFKAMDGNVNLKGSINARLAGDYKTLVSATFSDVNIRELFFEFGDFNQHNLTFENLAGRVNAEVEYVSDLSSELLVPPESVICFADLEISEGELINYKPLQKLSGYIKEDELKHVKFSKLKNKVKISNQVIHLPEMDIESSSLDISLFGQHTFQNQIEYHLQLLISDLISKKEKIKQDVGDNFEKDEQVGKTKLYLVMTGDAENPEINYDTREVRNKIAKDIEKEKQNLKNVLTKEFGRDKSNKKEEDSMQYIGKSGKDFLIEWEENDSIQTTKDSIKGKAFIKDTSDKKDFIIIWEEENDTIK